MGRVGILSLKVRIQPQRNTGDASKKNTKVKYKKPKKHHGSYLQNVYRLLGDMTNAHKTITELLNSIGSQCELKRSDSNKNSNPSSFTYVASVNLHEIL